MLNCFQSYLSLNKKITPITKKNTSNLTKLHNLVTQSHLTFKTISIRLAFYTLITIIIKKGGEGGKTKKDSNNSNLIFDCENFLAGKFGRRLDR